MQRLTRGAAAGAMAATAWLAAEPAIRKLTKLDYGERLLLGKLVVPDGPWKATGAVLHLIAGAIFGVAFSALGRGGIRDGVVAAQVESLVLWPGFFVIDRIHPDRDRLPPLPTDRRIVFHEAAGHLVFGLVLGALTRRNDK